MAERVTHQIEHVIYDEETDKDYRLRAEISYTINEWFENHGENLKEPMCEIVGVEIEWDGVPDDLSSEFLDKALEQIAENAENGGYE